MSDSSNNRNAVAAPPTITYRQAKNRIGRAWYGESWPFRLTDDERFDREAGPFKASSIEAYELTD
jgi:hypothetical protein